MRHQAIYNTHSTVVSINAETDARDIKGNVVELDESKIKTEQDKLEKQYSDQAYARKRKADYPSYAEQFDLLYHKGISGLKAELKKTKDKFPKP